MLARERTQLEAMRTGFLQEAKQQEQQQGKAGAAPAGQTAAQL